MRANPLSDTEKLYAVHHHSPECTHDYVVTSGTLQHIRHQLCGNGGTTAFFLILACIWEKWYNGSYPLCTSDLAGMDHNTELHERSIDRTTSGVNNVNIVLSNRLCDPD